MKVPLASESELDGGLAQWVNMMYTAGGSRSPLCPPRIRQGWPQAHPEVSQLPQGLEEAVPVDLEKTADVARVVRHGRRDDQAWTPLALDHVVIIGRVLLTPLRGFEPHRLKLVFFGSQCSPTLGRALVHKKTDSGPRLEPRTTQWRSTRGG